MKKKNSFIAAGILIFCLVIGCIVFQSRSNIEKKKKTLRIGVTLYRGMIPLLTISAERWRNR